MRRRARCEDSERIATGDLPVEFPTVFVVFNPDTSPQSKYFQRSIEAAGPSFGLEIAPAQVRSDAEIDAAIENAAQVGSAGLIFPTDSFTQLRKDRVVELIN